MPLKGFFFLHLYSTTLEWLSLQDWPFGGLLLLQGMNAIIYDFQIINFINFADFSDA